MDNTHPLLVPRWKVINDYPEPHNHPYYEVGYIIQAITNEDVQYLSKYPALFEPLPWYAERKVEEMPVYLKYNRADNGRMVVLRVENYEIRKDGSVIAWCEGSPSSITLDKIDHPATEAEYLTYKSSTEGKGGEG